MKKETMKEEQLQLVTYEQAEKLKKLKFNWECEYSYIEAGIVYTGNRTNTEYEREGYISRRTAPTVALALKWIRDKWNLENGVSPDIDIINDELKYFGHYFHLTLKILPGMNSFEAAESYLLDELIMILDKLPF
jgi:hypothetical protein